MSPLALARAAVNTVRGLWTVSRDMWKIVGDEIELHRELTRRDRLASNEQPVDRPFKP